MQMAVSAQHALGLPVGGGAAACNAQIRGLDVLQSLCTLELSALTSHLSADQFLALTLWKVFMY